MVRESVGGGEAWRFVDPMVFEALVVAWQIETVHEAWRIFLLASDWRGIDALEHALVAIMVRLCQMGRSGVWLDAIDTVAAAERATVFKAAMRCLERLAVAEFEGLRALIERLVERPTKGDLEVILGALERALYTAPASMLKVLFGGLEALLEALGAEVPDGRARIVQARALAGLDRGREAGVIYDARLARTSTLDPETVRRARVAKAELSLTSSHTMREAAALAASVGEAPRDATWAAALLVSAQVAIHSRAWDEARRWSQLARKTDDRRERMRAGLKLQWIAYNTNDHDGAPSEDLIAEAEELGHLDLLRLALAQRAIELRAGGRWHDAVTVGERVVDQARRSGRTGAQLVALRNLGVFRLDAGDLIGARSALRESTDLAFGVGRLDDACASLTMLALVDHESESDRATREHLERAMHLDIDASKKETARWLRWCFDRTPEAARGWREALPQEADRTTLQRAQSACVEIFDVEGNASIEVRIQRFEALSSAFGPGERRYELIELPLIPAMELVHAAMHDGLVTLAHRVLDLCASWTDGRPSRALRTMEARVLPDDRSSLAPNQPPRTLRDAATILRFTSATSTYRRPTRRSRRWIRPVRMWTHRASMDTSAAARSVSSSTIHHDAHWSASAVTMRARPRRRAAAAWSARTTGTPSAIASASG